MAIIQFAADQDANNKHLSLHQQSTRDTGLVLFTQLLTDIRQSEEISNEITATKIHTICEWLQLAEWKNLHDRTLIQPPPLTVMISFDDVYVITNFSTTLKLSWCAQTDPLNTKMFHFVAGWQQQPKSNEHFTKSQLLTMIHSPCILMCEGCGHLSYHYLLLTALEIIQPLQHHDPYVKTLVDKTVFLIKSQEALNPSKLLQQDQITRAAHTLTMLTQQPFTATHIIISGVRQWEDTESRIKFSMAITSTHGILDRAGLSHTNTYGLPVKNAPRILHHTNLSLDVPVGSSPPIFVEGPQTILVALHQPVVFTETTGSHLEMVDGKKTFLAFTLVSLKTATQLETGCCTVVASLRPITPTYAHHVNLAVTSHLQSKLPMSFFTILLVTVAKLKLKSHTIQSDEQLVLEVFLPGTLDKQSLQDSRDLIKTPMTQLATQTNSFRYGGITTLQMSKNASSFNFVPFPHEIRTLNKNIALYRLSPVSSTTAIYHAITQYRELWPHVHLVSKVPIFTNNKWQWVYVIHLSTTFNDTMLPNLTFEMKKVVKPFLNDDSDEPVINYSTNLPGYTIKHKLLQITLDQVVSVPHPDEPKLSWTTQTTKITNKQSKKPVGSTSSKTASIDSFFARSSVNNNE
jgi:hypothetical protein